jgi:hypothetical protein
MIEVGFDGCTPIKLLGLGASIFTVLHDQLKIITIKNEILMGVFLNSIGFYFKLQINNYSSTIFYIK